MAYMRWRRLIELSALDRPWIGEMFLRNRWKKAQAREPGFWDNEYTSGSYDRLGLSEQRHHIRLLAALVAEHAPNLRVLDIGCGDGAFYKAIRSHSPARYVGVDVSDVAIARAQDRYGADAGATFIVGDGSRFPTDETFDAIVFPECIEFLGDPVKVLDHYRGNLAEGGIFGVTQWLATRPLRIWRAVAAHTEVVDQAVVSAQWGGAWQVWTCRPRK